LPAAGFQPALAAFGETFPLKRLIKLGFVMRRFPPQSG
jgi:hypothetical protein